MGKFCEELLLIKTSNYNRLDRLGGRCVVGVERFELPTSCSQSRRATRLRYTPKCMLHIGWAAPDNTQHVIRGTSLDLKTSLFKRGAFYLTKP